MSKEQLKQIIFEAFKDVPKGEGRGARECSAEDDYATSWREKRYLDFLKTISVPAIIEHYHFTPEQVKACALYFLYDMHVDEMHYFFEERPKLIERVKRLNQIRLKYAKTPDSRTWEDELAEMDEKHRIVRDWFKAGGIEPNDYNVSTL